MALLHARNGRTFLCMYIGVSSLATFQFDVARREKMKENGNGKINGMDGKKQVISFFILQSFRFIEGGHHVLVSTLRTSSI